MKDFQLKATRCQINVSICLLHLYLSLFALLIRVIVSLHKEIKCLCCSLVSHKCISIHMDFGAQGATSESVVLLEGTSEIFHAAGVITSQPLQLRAHS